MNHDSKHEARVRPLRERLREETALAIAAAAEQVFAERGVHDARMEEIAARAGVAVGTVYNHFEDRDALLASLLEKRRAELAARLDRALAEGGHDPYEAQLRRFALTLFQHFETHRQFLIIMMEGEQAQVARPSEALRDRVEALIRRGVQKKALRPGRAALLPGVFMGAVKAVLLHDLRNPGELRPEERAEAAVDFFLNGARA